MHDVSPQIYIVRQESNATLKYYMSKGIKGDAISIGSAEIFMKVLDMNTSVKSTVLTAADLINK